MYYICTYVHIGLLVSFRWMRLPALKKRIFETFTHKQTTMYICKLYIYICMYIHTHLHVGALCQRCEVILLRRQRIPPLEHFISSHELLQYRMLPPPRRDKPARLSVLCYFCCYCLSFCFFFAVGLFHFIALSATHRLRWLCGPFALQRLCCKCCCCWLELMLPFIIFG